MAEFLQTSMAKIKEMVDVNTIVGDPVTTPDGVTLVPVSRVSFGFGGGGGDLVKQRSGFAGGSGAAVRIEPIGFLVIRNGIVNMLNIQPPAANTFDRIVTSSLSSWTRPSSSATRRRTLPPRDKERQHSQ